MPTPTPTPTSPTDGDLFAEFDAMLKRRMDELEYVDHAQGYQMLHARLDAWRETTVKEFLAFGLTAAARDVALVRGGPDYFGRERVEDRSRAFRNFLGETATHIIEGTFALKRCAPQDPDDGQSTTRAEVIDPKRVFVVHGRSDGPPAIVARVLEGMGLAAIILKEQANKGRTIIEKFVEEADVGFAVVLLTPDDVGRLKSEKSLASRARQNVVLELGWFVGRRGRDRVCALVEEGVEMPSDLAGLGYVPLDSAGAWKLALARELEAAGYAVDRRGIK
jgi:predicted nucleotide-binding protein